MGGGPSNSQTTTGTDAKYPAEFAPLASSAVKQIQQLQGALPLATFSQAQPQGVAGISPFQQATMNMLPSTLAPSWGLQTMQNLTPGFSNVMNNATIAGNNPNNIYSGALQALGSGGFGAGKPAFPAMPTQFMDMTKVQLPNAQTNQTVLGPHTENVMAQLQGLNRAVPNSTPVQSSPVIGPSTYNMFSNTGVPGGWFQT